MTVIRNALVAVAVLTMSPAETKPQYRPRDIVEGIAIQIAYNYFDEGRAEAIAAKLRSEAERGDYDRYGDPRDLAQALTDRLVPLDRHFLVTWSPSAANLAKFRRADVGLDPDRERRNNYGFRAVEVLPGNVGYVDLRHFAEIAPDGLAQARADATMTLLSGTDAIVLDLRENGGGSPAMVGYLVSYFVPANADVYNTFRGRDSYSRETPPVGLRGARRLKVPLYLLLSARTASAAESFAYTLQAAKRAVLVGERSEGAANPGGFARVGHGFAVFVSAGQPVNPITGSNWEGAGVRPDVGVPSSKALARAQTLALEAVLKTRREGPAETEARWALAQMRSPLALPPAALAPYVGDYGSRSIALDRDRLVLGGGRRPALPLKPLARDEFAIDDKDTPRRLLFERDGHRRIVGLVVKFSDGDAQHYARKWPSSHGRPNPTTK